MLALPATRASSAAAPPWFTRTWQSDEGLPDNTVIGVAKTPDGFLRVSTKTGLVSFDGVRFQPFPVLSDGALADRIWKMSCRLRPWRQYFPLRPA